MSSKSTLCFQLHVLSIAYVYKKIDIFHATKIAIIYFLCVELVIYLHKIRGINKTRHEKVLYINKVIT